MGGGVNEGARRTWTEITTRDAVIKYRTTGGFKLHLGK